MTPVPLVDFVKVQNKKLVEIHGENFTPDLTIWFNDVAAQTLYRCEEFLLCIPPTFAEMTDGKQTHCRQRTKVNISLVRSDGIIYGTDKVYTYEVEPLPLTS